MATVTLNAALDVTLHVHALRPGGKQPLGAEHLQAGGKGVNVARVLGALGVPALAVVVVGGEPGERILASLAADALAALPVRAPGDSRTCLEIVEASGTATQLHGAGVAGSAAVVAEVAGAIDTLPESVEWVALCGSLAPGMPDTAVAHLVERSLARGLRCAVDTRDGALERAVGANPTLLRINREEWESLAGPAPASEPAMTVVSNGADPFEAWDRERAFRVTPPAVEAVNPIGCGDAMMAGLLAAFLDGDALEPALRRAAALASAEAESSLAGRPDLDRARRIEAAVTIDATPR